MGDKINFKDILVPRRTQCGVFKHMTRDWKPQKTMTLSKIYSAQDLKYLTANSVYMDSVIEVESIRSGVNKDKLKQEVQQYLEEMGFDKKMHVIRWMGVIFLQMAFRMNIGIYVNEPPVLKLKSVMGKNPVIFLPTHRSYADFCLMTYLCYDYDIELPAVAAGMDFYSMAVLGRLLRETGAFYIRRTLVGAPLYAATFSHYVRTIVSKNSAPIEFFLEGTRSRSNKSLSPKYGVLAMSLLPFFSREVTDVTIVPVNISYDRLMEHGLFAYEHLGVPKPKESTGGLLKALRSLNDYFGNIYINLGTPLSVKSYFANTFQTEEMVKPVDVQQMTPDQFKQVQELAEHVVTLQQANTVATISNLLAVVLMNSIIQNRALTLPEVLEELDWLMIVLKELGASVFVDETATSLKNVLVVHKLMMTLDKDGKLRLISSALMDISTDVKNKMKGHILKAETMVHAVPIIQLQMYVNPVLHYLVPPAIVYLIVKRGTIYKEQLATDYRNIRRLFRHEFFYTDRNEEQTFQQAIEYCVQNNVIVYSDAAYSASADTRLSHLLRWNVWPALSTMLKCADVITEQRHCEHKRALRLIQERVESSNCHPYSLSLESAANCLQGLVLAGALVKERGQDISYSVMPVIMERCRHLVNSVLPDFSVDFGRSNSVVLDPRVVSRL